jgi:arylformamidase
MKKKPLKPNHNYEIFILQKKTTMIIEFSFKEKKYLADLSKPLDISIPLRAGEKNVSAWYVDPVKIEPVKTEHFVGDVNQGGSVNFRNISFNPHGNGTHTECVGHISKENYTINKCLQKFHFIAELVTITPEEKENGDKTISLSLLKKALAGKIPEAIIIRTLPNEIEKTDKDYSNTNPPYIEKEAIDLLNDLGIEHLLIDLPSIDREMDEGKLNAHHAFWQYPHNRLLNKTITELIYVPTHINDGSYLLNIQIAPFENDASPSKPVIYSLL